MARLALVAVDCGCRCALLGADFTLDIPTFLSTVDAVRSVDELDRHASRPCVRVLCGYPSYWVVYADSFEGSTAKTLGSRGFELSSQECRECPPTHGAAVLMIEFFTDLWDFMRVRKKFWLAPIIIVLLLLGALIVFAQGSAVAPFIYTLF